MVKTLQEKVEEVYKILKSNDFIDIITEKSINNSGNIFISTSQKEDVRGNPVIVIVLKREEKYGK